MFLAILVTAFVSLFVGIVILGHIFLLMAAFHGKSGREQAITDATSDMNDAASADLVHVRR
ncbi:MAG: hypothetical protein HY659_05305 [Rhizobiales bacterium]|nr:hypothetical protein [Hyphomicrobiales bacterium]